MKLFFAGDICVHEALEKNPLCNITSKIIEDSTYSLATWEAPIITHNSTKKIKVGPTIKQNRGWEYFAEVFDYVSIANNHIMDYGKQGLENTISKLEEFKLQTFGAGGDAITAYQPLFITSDSHKIAILGVGEAQFGALKYENLNAGYAWIFHSKVLKQINELHKKGFFIILMCHAGLEMATIPLPEWKDCYHNFIDWGADLIIASHPHVIQGKELYKKKWIYYSLGNFFFNLPQSANDWYKSMGLEVKIKNDKEVDIVEHFFMFSKGSVSYDDSNETKKIFQERTNQISNKSVYDDLLNKILVNSWNNTYKKYYAYKVTNQKYEKLPWLLQKLWNRVSNKYLIEGNEAMILHNIMIETHKFAVERYLKIKHKML